MRKLVRLGAWVPCAIVLASCASGGGSGGATTGKYTRDLGRLLVPTLAEARVKVWQKHNWHLRREEGEYANFYWESEWRPFEPPAAAAVTGPTDGRIRIVIRGRVVAGELDGGSLYRVTFEGEYEVRGGISAEWRPEPVPDAAREVFEAVAGDMALEVRTGVRR